MTNFTFNVLPSAGDEYREKIFVEGCRPAADLSPETAGPRALCVIEEHFKEDWMKRIGTLALLAGLLILGGVATAVAGSVEMPESVLNSLTIFWESVKKNSMRISLSPQGPIPLARKKH